MTSLSDLDRLHAERLDALVESLFVNGFGHVAERLVLTDASGRDLGGWCRGAVRDRIEAFASKLATDAARAQMEKQDG